ncbi:MAG: hypothetical protein ACK5JT_03775 [Hyphomicrobiaceae bacterium]
MTVLLAMSAMLGACAGGDTQPLQGFSGMSSLSIVQPVPGEAATTGSVPEQKTLSDKILAAIALERVTGLKPDPARFTE